MKRWNMPLVAALLLVSLGIGTEQVKAYGNTTNYTINCPTMRFTGTSDNAFSNPLGQYYVMGRLIDQTNGLDMTFSPIVIRREVIVTPIGSTYISYTFDQTYNLSSYIKIGDVIWVWLYDRTDTLLNITFACVPSSGSTLPPSGYTLMTVICSAYILSSPAGPVLSLPLHSYATPPEVSKQRYVLPLGAMGSDGQLYDKIQADAMTFGYFPRRCLG